jgi:hypothetical protein
LVQAEIEPAKKEFQELVKRELGVDHFHVDIHIDRDKELDVRELNNNSEKSVSEYGE